MFPGVQHWTAVRASAWVSHQAETEVSIEQVRLRFFRKFAFGEVYIEDYNGDTLLYTRELVTRIDAFNPFQKRIQVQHIRLRGAQFAMRRELGDSTFSFTDFLQTLGGDKSPSAHEPGIQPLPKKNSKTWQMSLGELELGDSRFRYLDDNSRTYMDIRIPHLLALMRKTNPSAKILSASRLELTDLDVRFFKPDSARGPIWVIPPDTPRLNVDGILYSADELILKNCRFVYDDARRESRQGFDFAHMDIRDINIKCSNVKFNTDTITARIRNIQVRDKSGLELKSMSADFFLTNKMVKLSGLKLETPWSSISDTIILDYGSFHAFERFETDVRMDGWFDKSRIGIKDLQQFAPNMEILDGTLELNGHIYGTVNDLHGRNIDLAFGSNSTFKGRFDVAGLPLVNETFIEFKLENLQTTAMDIRRILPGLTIPSSLNTLGSMQAKGIFTGFVSDFVAFGQVNTSIGTIQSDLNLKIEPDQDLVSYSGKLDLSNFDLGIWSNEPDWLGKVTASSTVKGSGKSSAFGLDNLDALLNANVSSLYIRGYQYTNLQFDGQMQEGFFEGSLESGDPNFDQTFLGTIDMRNDLPIFDFQSNVRNIDFYALGLMPNPLNMQGRIALNLVGDDIDSLLGHGGIFHLTMEDSIRTYALDSLTLNAREEEGRRYLNLESELFSAGIEGHFKLTRLPDAIKQLVNHYFPNAGLPIKNDVGDQNMNFAVSIRDSKEFFKLLDPKLETVKNVLISGSLNSLSAGFDLRAKIPKIEYGGVQLDSWVVDVQTSESSLKLFTRTEKIVLGDSISSPITVLEADYQNDSLLFTLMVGRDEDLDRLNLVGAVTAATRAFQMSILPSEIYMGGLRWDISPNNSLWYDYKNLTVKDFRLNSGDQQIALSSVDKEGFDTWLDLDLQSVDIGLILSAFRINPMDLSGRLSGRVSGSNVLTNLGFAANLSLLDMHLAELPLGNLTLNASAQRPDNVLNFNLALADQSEVRALGHIGLDAGQSLEADVRIDRLPAAPLGRYLDGLFDQVDGFIKGDIKLRGTFTEPMFSGNASIQDGTLRLIYLNTRYIIPALDIQLNPGRLTIAPTAILDEEGNTGELEGVVSYTGLDSWSFENLQIKTDHMRFMKTDSKSNPEFYGTAYGNGQVSINGPLNDIQITILASSNRGTALVIPITYGPSVGGSNFVTFRKPANENVSSSVPVKRIGRVRFEFYLNITEDAEGTIELLGDKLTAKGQGNLHLSLSTSGDFTMDGTFKVNEGSYNFSLQDLVSKDFRIDPGSTITWSGDPYQAQLQVNAIYTARASQWDLVSNYSASMTSQEIDQAQQLQNVDVYLKLGGSLESPDITFDIQVPGGQSGGTSIFERRLQEIKADENELNKQVFGLLVINRFIPDAPGVSPLLSSASNSVSEFVTKQLSSYVTDWVSDFLVTDVDIDVSYRNYQSAQQDLTQQELQIALSKRFFDNRIYVNVGGNFGVGQSQDPTDPTGRNNNVAGDFEIEYALTADGRFRIKAFQRPDYDVISGQNIAETGVGLFYSQEFDTLDDLFADRRKRKTLRQKAKNPELIQN